MSRELGATEAMKSNSTHFHAMAMTRGGRVSRARRCLLVLAGWRGLKLLVVVALRRSSPLSADLFAAFALLISLQTTRRLPLWEL